MEFSPQPGPQERALASPADILIYGGAAGSGKSWTLLLEPLRHIGNPRFGAVIFRRTSPQLTGAGSLWEEAQTMYPALGAKLREHPYFIVEFPSGATIQLTHLQHFRDVLNHQGKGYALICWDEITHFLSAQFWYLVSRLRTMAGIRPYMRATCNPDPDSFVRKLIAWWVGDPDCDGCQAGACRDPEHGIPNPARSGVLRWFVRKSGRLYWADTPMELVERFGEDAKPLSLTFIGARLEDNPALEGVDPSYRSRLEALPEIEQERLLRGNWNVRPEGGKYIQQAWFADRWHELPPGLNIYMASDFAVTEPQDEDDDPDYTEHGIFGVDGNDTLYVIDWWYDRVTSDVWIDSLLDMWARYQPLCWFGEGGVIRHAIEPLLKKRMQERRIYGRVEWVNPTGRTYAMSSSNEGFSDRSKQTKAIRGRSFQARAACGKIRFPNSAEWLTHVIDSIVKFPSKGHDDSFDVLSLMCLAIEQALPGVAPTEESEDEPRRRWMTQRRTGSYRTA